MGQSTLIAGPNGTGGVLGINGAGPWNLATEITCAVSGNNLVGVGFYKNAGDTGTHIANVWRVSDQALLGQQTFTAETASGWQWVTFTTPIPLTAGVAYRACVTHPVQYPGTSNLPTIVVGPYTVSSGASGNNSAANSGVNYPSTGFGGWYFGTDVLVDGFPGALSARPFWYPGPTPVSLTSGGGGPFVVSQDVTPSVASAVIDQVLYYKIAADTVTGNRPWTIYRTDTQAVVASGTFGTETASGWQVATLGTPLALLNGITYRVAILTGTTHGYNSGFGGSSMPGIAMAAAANYAASGTMVYPTTASAGTYYGIDLWLDGLSPTALYSSQALAETWEVGPGTLAASQVLAEVWAQNQPPTDLRASQDLTETWVTNSGAPTQLRASQDLAEVWVLTTQPKMPARRVSSQVI